MVPVPNIGEGSRGAPSRCSRTVHRKPSVGISVCAVAAATGSAIWGHNAFVAKGIQDVWPLAMSARESHKRPEHLAQTCCVLRGKGCTRVFSWPWPVQQTRCRSSARCLAGSAGSGDSQAASPSSELLTSSIRPRTLRVPGFFSRVASGSSGRREMPSGLGSGPRAAVPVSGGPLQANLRRRLETALRGGGCQKVKRRSFPVRSTGEGDVG